MNSAAVSGVSKIPNDLHGIHARPAAVRCLAILGLR